MFPIYMREDPDFCKFYNHLDDIFTQIEEAIKGILSSLEQNNINSKAFLKVLSLFGQTAEFTREGTVVDGIYYTEDTNEWHAIYPEGQQQIKFKFSTTVLYFCAKFNTLKNNFKGTFKNLSDSLTNSFDINKDYVAFTCNQSLVKENTQDLTRDMTLITINVDLNPLLMNRFPPEEAYPEGTAKWNINSIPESWYDASKENREKYDFYKSFLELLTLFINNYFSLNILGTLTQFNLSGKAPILKWNESNFNEAMWSNTTVQGGE